ncbi:sce7726 family protein [Gleimia sp. 6138-11-ORH1]|uniref:sce7726 family protein n=1 Tax=Gleimia sp. 6138-11-ORH1 TaxID=2973937 RepID=UPI00216754C8|nr:sce7726 family protein [Gleimia sp. 6138-11-ORH1]MCS4484372.1 sce7726 family protein [Gleimia sp. 6138-11-ORH1]
MDSIALSQLFAPSMVRAISEGTYRDRLMRILSEAGVHPLDFLNLDELYAYAYKVLSKEGLRPDYYFRNKIIEKLVLGRHSLNTTTVLNEFRVRDSILDLGIVNGELIAYEIKSDRDSLFRLSSQFEDYRRFFRFINVVTAEKHVRTIKKEMPSHVGIIVLTKRGTLHIERRAEDQIAFNDPVTMAASLRKAEVLEVIKRLGFEMEEVPNTLFHRIASSYFRAADPEELSTCIRGTLRKSRDFSYLSSELDCFPIYSKSMALCLLKTKVARENYLEAIRQPLFLEEACITHTYEENNSNLQRFKRWQVEES